MLLCILPQDEYYQIRGFVCAFNHRRATLITPGERLLIDECMLWWLGKDGKWTIVGMPHVTKIIRKPRGIGMEMKSLADGITGILLQLEIMEGAAAQALKPHSQHGQGTAVCLRLTTPWHGQGRCLVGDSAFGSVKSCVQMAAVGFDTWFQVKTAQREYPLAYLRRWQEDGLQQDPRCFAGRILC